MNSDQMMYAPGRGEMTRFSIALCTYNGARHLEEQLASLAAQTLLPFELVVGDDGSADETLAILEHFRERAPFPVHIEVNSTACGYGENFMRTAARCSGDWICFCDQDDVWLPGKLEACARAIGRDKSEDIQLVVHEADVGDEELRPMRRLYGLRRDSLFGPLSLSPEWYCLGFTQIFSASLVRDVPWGDRLSLSWHEHRNAHDVWIALIANVTGSILFLAEPLAIYRRHGGTVTGSSTHSFAEKWLASIRDDGCIYEQRAEYLSQVGSKLRVLAGQVSSVRLSSRLEAGADLIDRQRASMMARAEMFRKPGRGAALTALLSFYQRGGYTRGPWPFGRSRFLRDLLSIFARDLLPRRP